MGRLKLQLMECVDRWPILVDNAVQLSLLNPFIEMLYVVEIFTPSFLRSVSFWKSANLSGENEDLRADNPLSIFIVPMELLPAYTRSSAKAGISTSRSNCAFLYSIWRCHFFPTHLFAKKIINLYTPLSFFFFFFFCMRIFLAA